MESELEAVTKILDSLVEFSVVYGFQIVGALVFLVIGLKAGGWLGGKTMKMAEAKKMDPALARFVGSIVKILVIVFVIIISLGNFGISIAPLIALAGASAFGATLALQGPLSNYGAGLSIMFSRPFKVGDTINLKRMSGVVDDVTLAATVLVGEDKERITIPNKEVVGQVIVNSLANRIVETRIPLAAAEDAGRATQVIRDALGNSSVTAGEPPAQVGIHDFTFGGVVIGLRAWVPSSQYFQNRYALNQEIYDALNSAGISLAAPASMAVAATSMSADADPEPDTPSE